jgi:AraC-like DNA-binding protein
MAWSLEAMADVAGMSRTAFANRFREVMSHTPGSYLTRLRLLIARRAVISGQGLKHAAKLSGYASVTALSRALTQNTNAH